MLRSWLTWDSRWPWSNKLKLCARWRSEINSRESKGKKWKKDFNEKPLKFEPKGHTFPKTIKIQPLDICLFFDFWINKKWEYAFWIHLTIG